jgi:hypothetical protein
MHLEFVYYKSDDNLITHIVNEDLLRARVRARAGARFVFNLFRFLGHLSEDG